MPHFSADTGREASQQNIRLPHDVRDRIRKLAIAERRSFGAQVVVLLETALANKAAETASTVPAE